MVLLVYPVYNYLNNKRNNTNLYSVIAVFVAILTLWHYGSLVRSTSIFIFYAIYSISVRNYSLVDEN